jgi:hypothetical protein
MKPATVSVTCGCLLKSHSLMVKSVKDTFEVVLADPSGRWLGEGYGGLENTAGHLPA